MKESLKIFCTFCFLCIFFSCQKEVGPIDNQQEYFFKKFGGEAAEFGVGMLQTVDGGFLLFGTDSDNHYQFRITKLDANGHHVSTIKVATDGEMFSQAKRLKNGAIVVNSLFSDEHFVVSEAGQILAHNRLDSINLTGTYIFSRPLEGNDGNLYTSYTNGPSSGSSENYISALTEDGIEIDFEYLANTRFNGKLLTCLLYKVNADVDGKEYWLTGFMYNKSSWSWSDPQKTYFAKISKDGSIKLNVLDPNTDRSNMVIDYQNTPDNNIVTLTSEALWFYSRTAKYTSEFELVKVNENTDVVWRKQFVVEKAVAVHPTALRITTEGDFIVSGFCTKRGQAFSSSFVVRIDKDGTKKFQKIYDFGESAFYMGIETSSGGLAFTGFVADFGKGKEFSDQFILKTDKSGNYQ